VEYARCTRCRNPIRAHQREVSHPATGSRFHDDCWAAVHDTIQDEYARMVSKEGLAGLLSPYVITLSGEPWLPERVVAELEGADAEVAVDHLGTPTSS
jgi:hypothetical protein